MTENSVIVSGNLHRVSNRDVDLVMINKYGEKYRKYREKWMRSSADDLELDFPLHLDIDLQDSCNIKCVLCHQLYRSRTHDVIDFELVRKIIDEGVCKGLGAINFGASGEPLLQKELLLESIRYASKKGIMSIFMHTNGILLDKDTSKALIEAGLSHLCLSLDASNQETYEKVRCNEAYEKVISNLNDFIKLRKSKGLEIPLVRVSFVVMDFNYKERDSFVDLWQDRVDIVEFQKFSCNNDVEVNEDIFEREYFNCPSPFNRMMVWPDGTATLCCLYREDDVLLGNVKEKSIEELWKSEKKDAVRTSFRTQKGIPQTCSVCMSSYYKLKESV